MSARPGSAGRSEHDGAGRPATGAQTTQVYVSHLRKVLGRGVLVSRDGGCVLEAEDEDVDVCRFESLSTDARRG